MSEHKAVPAPRTLNTAGKRVWESVAKVYELRADELEILRAAAGEADLIYRMETELKGMSLTAFGSTGQVVAHPFVSELRQHRATLSALLKSLKLPDDAPAAQVNAQRTGGQSRWANAHGKAV
jgi:hypothetical protein